MNKKGQGLWILGLISVIILSMFLIGMTVGYSYGIKEKQEKTNTSVEPYVVERYPCGCLHDSSVEYCYKGENPCEDHIEAMREHLDCEEGYGSGKDFSCMVFKNQTKKDNTKLVVKNNPDGSNDLIHDNEYHCLSAVCTPYDCTCTSRLETEEEITSYAQGICNKLGKTNMLYTDTNHIYCCDNKVMNDCIKILGDN